MSCKLESNSQRVKKGIPLFKESNGNHALKERGRNEGLVKATAAEVGYGLLDSCGDLFAV